MRLNNTIHGRVRTVLSCVLAFTFMLTMAACKKEAENNSQDASNINNNIVETETIGLSDSYNIGVKEDKLHNEVLYNVPADIKNVINATDYGVKADDGYDDTVALEKVFEAVAKNGGEPTKVVLPKGTLNFVEGMGSANINIDTFITVKNIKNMVIVGDGTTFMFHGILKGIQFVECENVMITGINVDWGRTPFSMGVITKTDGQTFEVTVNQGYPVDENTVIAGFLEYDAKTNAPRVEGNDIYGDVSTVEYLGNQKLRIKFNTKYDVSPVGTKVVLRHELYGSDAITVRNCKNMTFEAVNIYAAPGMAFMGYSSDNLYFNRFNVMLKPETDRLMSVTADGIHLMDCGGDVKVTNSLFENTGDDAFNAHGAYLVIKEIIDKNTVYAENPRGYNFKPEVGNIVEFSMASTLLPELSATVVESKVSDKGQGFVLKVDKELPAEIALEDVIANATRTPKVKFINNLVRNKRCRGILVQTRDALIENNTFANLGNGGVLITTDAGAWFESLGSYDVIVRNNKFVGNNMAKGKTEGDISAIALAKDDIYGPPGVFKNLTIENNFIANTGNAGIFINSANGVSIVHNLISSPGLKASSKYYNSGIGASYVDNMNVKYNEVVANSSQDFKGISLGAAVNFDTLKVENNTGIDTSGLESQKIQTLEINQLSGTINVTDKTLDDWNNVGTDIKMNGMTDSDQNQVTLDENSFKLNFAKITWDKDNIYFAFDVNDDKISWVPEQFWLGDGVEVFLTTNTKANQPMEVLKFQDENCLQLFMGGTPTGGCKVLETRTSATVMKLKDQFQMNLWEKTGGYCGEGKIPINAVPNLRQAIDDGNEVKFVIRFADSETNKLQIQVSNAPHPVEFNKFVPARMPSVKFVK